MAGAKAANALIKYLGVTSHLISPIEELAIENQPDTKNVVGFNSKRVLQLSDNRKRTNIGSTELRSHLTYGSDLGIDMQTENDGYSFSLTNYQKLDAQKRKTFLSVATAAIADQVARTEYENNCKCVWRHGIHAVEVCTVADTKSVTPVVVSIFRNLISLFPHENNFLIQMSLVLSEKTKSRINEHCQSRRKRQKHADRIKINK